jgi:uncharacterized protein (DUF58 family)
MGSPCRRSSTDWLSSLAEPSATLGARRAEALGARLPPLLVAAERVAATVAQGVHGRRRTGQGESFWQFRPFTAGDPVNRIDWRQSAKSDRAFVRETEWEAAQTVVLWRDGSASMRWRSRLAATEKQERAGLLLLALAALLLRGGERVALLGERAVSGRTGLDSLADKLSRTVDDDSGEPPAAFVPRHCRVVLISDFLAPLEQIQASVARFAGTPASLHLLQVLDPAEATLPYQGRVRFRGMEREADTLIPRVEGVRAAYAQALAAHQEGLTAIAAGAGCRFTVHHTDHPAEAALLGLYTSLANR